MGTIAKGGITLSSVNDAYTVLLTPSSCSISADFDGSNPALFNAKGTLTIKRGTKTVPFKVDKVSFSDTEIKASWIFIEEATLQFYITQLPITVLDGFVKFHIVTNDGFNYSTDVQFSFNIVRESTMLDWIQDWEGSKTKVGGTYIMTPKLFVGKKEAVLDTSGMEPMWKEGALTGVYIGPDLLASGESSVGIYGYLKDRKIFYINADGGFIGGWTFNEGGLQSSNGIVNILSEGSIFAQNPNSETPYWGIYANGTASFSNGNVKFNSDGSAEFAGKITAKSGSIGGWSITENQLHSLRIIINSKLGYIGINASDAIAFDPATGIPVFPSNPSGGVKMWYTSGADFGFAGWSTGNKVFHVGSDNFIAGWKFSHQAIWTGSDTPFLTQGGYATSDSCITIAPNGIRSSKWFVDANGTASFVGGNVKFNSVNAEMFGWLMRENRFSSHHAALVSQASYSGLFVSPADLSEVGSTMLETTINNNGGIYLYSNGTNSILRAYDKSGNLGFSLNTSGNNSIARWSFDSEAIYIGSKSIGTTGFTTSDGSMVLKSSGIFGYKWKMLADGSGALAGGKINWDKDGNIVVDAQISANNITAGTISTASIKCEGKWLLDQNGTGYLANGNITWNQYGDVELNKINAQSGKIAGFVISSNSLTNEGFDNDACVIFRNDRYNVFGAMGGNTMPTSSGMRSVARFQNEDSTSQWYSRNIALILSAKNGTQNHAFLGSGNGTLDGWIGGHRMDRFTFTESDTIYSNYISLAKNNRWICKSHGSGSGVMLPSLYDVQDALGIGRSTPFCVEFTILADIGTNGFYIYGRTDRKDGAGNQPWITEQNPVFVHWNGDRWERQSLGAGDVFHVWLVYDPNETQTLGGFSCKYTARVISHVS